MLKFDRCDQGFADYESFVNSILPSSPDIRK